MCLCAHTRVRVYLHLFIPVTCFLFTVVEKRGFCSIYSLSWKKLCTGANIWVRYVEYLWHISTTKAHLPSYLPFLFERNGLFLTLSSCDITSVCAPGPLRTTPRGTGGRRPPFIPPQLLKKRRKKGTCTLYKCTKLLIKYSDAEHFYSVSSPKLAWILV